jgi:hypothetical protein
MGGHGGEEEEVTRWLRAELDNQPTEGRNRDDVGRWWQAWRVAGARRRVSERRGQASGT